MLCSSTSEFNPPTIASLIRLGVYFLAVINAVATGKLKNKLEKESTTSQSLSETGSTRGKDEGGPNFTKFKGRDVTAGAPKIPEVSIQFLNEVSAFNSLDQSEDLVTSFTAIVDNIMEKEVDIASSAKAVRTLRLESKIKDCLLFLAEEHFKRFRGNSPPTPERKMINSLETIKKQFEDQNEETEDADHAAELIVPHYNHKTGEIYSALC